MKRFAVFVAVFSVVFYCLWLVGLILSDRWGWSQWLAWIPTLFILVLLAAALVLYSIEKRSKALFFLTPLFLTSVYWFIFEENRFFSSADSSGSIRLVGWTMSHSKKNVSYESAKEIIRLNGDITLLTHGWYVRSEPIIKDWLGVGRRVVTNGPFTILTKHDVLEVQTLVASEGIYISKFVIDATEKIGKTIDLWAVDLPSDLFTPRIETAERALRLYSQVESNQPDIVIGDFNMTRNSYAIKHMFPNLIDASNLGGSGLLASFPLHFPLYCIDHTLVGRELVCNSYVFSNPHIGRHRVQITELSSLK
jgi:hypothetical protein